jgi:hypothetical protein
MRKILVAAALLASLGIIAGADASEQVVGPTTPQAARPVADDASRDRPSDARQQHEQRESARRRHELSGTGERYVGRNRETRKLREDHEHRNGREHHDETKSQLTSPL